MKDQRTCMVHSDDKGILEDSGRFLARIPRGGPVMVPWQRGKLGQANCIKAQHVTDVVTVAMETGVTLSCS